MSYFFIATDEKFCKIQIFIGCFAYLYPFLKKKHITILILCFSMQFLLEWNKASWGENTALHVQLRIISTCFFYIFEERDDVHREPVQTTQEANMRLQWESSGTPFFFFCTMRVQHLLTISGPPFWMNHQSGDCVEAPNLKFQFWVDSRLKLRFGIS